MKLSASLLVASFAALASAEKDEAYYTNGITNPNVDQKMYWHQGYNVLEDLDQFDKLYITYHNCAWETPISDEDGGGGDEGDTWYLGSVPSFRANAAFSLYGVLKGDTDKGCNKRSFINSFHTTNGVESFTNAIAAAGMTDLFNFLDEDEDVDDAYDGLAESSVCYGDEDRKRALGDDYVTNGEKYSGYYTSYGVGCSANNKKKFALQTYAGALCDPNDITEVLDELQDYNDRLSMSKCVPIYTDGDYYAGMGEDNKDEDGSSPLTILETARACQVHDGTESCPDPYGQLYRREKALQRALNPDATYWTPHRIMVASWTMIAGGIALTLAGIAIFAMDACRPRNNVKTLKTLSEDMEDDGLGKPSTLDRNRTNESLASRISQAASEAASKAASAISLAFSKTSKDSKRSKRSNKSKKSEKSRRSNKSNQSDRTTPSHKEGDDLVPAGREIDITRSTSYVSHTSHLSQDSDAAVDAVNEGEGKETNIEEHNIEEPIDAIIGSGSDDKEEEEDDDNKSTAESIAASVQASISNMVDNFMKAKPSDAFQDEESAPNTYTMASTPAETAMVAAAAAPTKSKPRRKFSLKKKKAKSTTISSTIPSTLPQSNQGRSDVEVDSGWTEPEASAANRRWRKRQWFRRLTGQK